MEMRENIGRLSSLGGASASGQWAAGVLSGGGGDILIRKVVPITARRKIW